MFKKVLVANRGVVAVRVQKACEKLGIQTVAVYTPPDANSVHSKSHVNAGAYCIRDYTEIPEIISVANECRADAIHPGVGFLSESPDFVFEVINQTGACFIGPSLDSIILMGDKIKAREIARQAGTSIIPGSDGNVSEKEAMEIARAMGFPLRIKASSGGGGLGMKVVYRERDLIPALREVKHHAKQLFNNDSVYIERNIERARHLEVQLLGDNYGNMVHLGIRDCTEQRRNQKLVEFSPPDLKADGLSRLTSSALGIAKQINYSNAGTIEYLLNSSDNHYFMEANTRLQVEHRVTEMLTGIDIVAEQLRLASGEKLGYCQQDITFRGFAIECRINAEDHENNFMACPGLITRFIPPAETGWLVVDTYIPRIKNGRSTYQISERYDSLLANVIVHGHSKGEAIERMNSALSEFEIKGEGVKTTIPFHLKYLKRNYLSS